MNVIDTKNAPGAIGPYSQAYEANGFVITSGQIPVNPADGTVPEGIAARMLVPSSKQRVPILPRYSRRHASSQIWVILQLSTRFMRIILRPSPPAVVLL